MKQPLLVQQGEKELLPDWHWDNYIMGFAKPIEQIFIKLSRYIYVSKRYYTRERWNEHEKDEWEKTDIFVDDNTGRGTVFLF